MKQKTVIFYSTPAHGHINPVLPLLSELAENGCRVIFYSSAEFQGAAMSCGAEFREYNFGGLVFDTKIGSHILPLTELVLKFTLYSADKLLEQAEKLLPDLIIHDTLALWGRNIAQLTGTKAVCINSIVTVGTFMSRSFCMYASGFTGSSIKELYCLPSVLKRKSELKKRYGTKNLSLINILMNREKLNLYTYPRILHPDGNKMGKNHFFIGPAALMRKNGFIDENNYNLQNLIYVSLGTVFNSSEKFWDNIINSFSGTKYNVVISCGSSYDHLLKKIIPDNILIRKYVNQNSVLDNSVLFISAGGMNSICEAVSKGVPCLLCPQQGEQAINSKMLESIGAAKILKKHSDIFNEAEKLINSFSKNDEIINEFNKVNIDEAVKLLKKL